jgi:hypothetical protein
MTEENKVIIQTNEGVSCFVVKDTRTKNNEVVKCILPSRGVNKYADILTIEKKEVQMVGEFKCKEEVKGFTTCKRK